MSPFSPPPLFQSIYGGHIHRWIFTVLLTWRQHGDDRLCGSRFFVPNSHSFSLTVFYLRHIISLRLWPTFSPELFIMSFSLVYKLQTYDNRVVTDDTFSLCVYEGLDNKATAFLFHPFLPSFQSAGHSSLHPVLPTHPTCNRESHSRTCHDSTYPTDTPTFSPTNLPPNCEE